MVSLCETRDLQVESTFHVENLFCNQGYLLSHAKGWRPCLWSLWYRCETGSLLPLHVFEFVWTSEGNAEMNEGTNAESQGPLLAAMWTLTDLENVISESVIWLVSVWSKLSFWLQICEDFFLVRMLFWPLSCFFNQHCFHYSAGKGKSAESQNIPAP